MKNPNNYHIGADGSIHILITKGWEPPPPQPVIISHSSPDTKKTIIINGNSGNAHKLPDIPQPHHMLFKLPEIKSGSNLMPITVICDVHQKVDNELNLALSRYSENIDKIKDASEFLSDYHHSDIPDSMSLLFEKVTNHLSELDKKDNEINEKKDSIKKQKKYTDEQFNALMHHNYVLLGNVKELASKDPNKLDLLYSFIMNTSHIKKDFYVNSWKEMIENPNDRLITLKNNLIVLLTVASSIASELDNDISKLNENNDENDNSAINAAKFSADVAKDISKLYGKRAEELAKEIALKAKGKKIRNINDAAIEYEKHRHNIDKKINAKDRMAIAHYLDYLDVRQASVTFNKLGRSMGYAGYTVYVHQLYSEMKEAIRTNNWRPFFVKAETILAGMGAGAVCGLALSFLTGGPLSIIAFGFIMAGISVLIDDQLIEKVNKFIGI
ncbi:colicin-like pore-forming protein [Morganella morganii]|uniref:colicin-like pore-forming protein n=1 Tax=Morganella morganii TaxID=582 RepID=UPI003EBB64B7